MKNYSQKINVKREQTIIKVRSMCDGAAIEISCSPLSYLQQHNLFGCNDLVGLVSGVFYLVAEKLEINVDEQTARRIRVGNYELLRVDVAANYWMPNAESVEDAVRKIGLCWFLQNKRVSVYPGQTAYLNQHSEYWSLKFYAKLNQMIASKKKIPHKDSLFRYASRVVRGELMLKAKELRSRQLNRGHAWSDKSLPKKLLLEKVEESGLVGEVKLRLYPKELKNLSPSLKRAYIAWVHGESVRSLYAPANYYRLVSQFNEFGVDISKAPPPNSVTMPQLSELFSEDKIRRWPVWAMDKGLVFIPKVRDKDD